MATQVQEYAKLIELPLQRKLMSLLEGQHGGVGAGSSHEFLDMAEYKVGDDVSDIDWKSTARMGQPIVKRFESTAVLNVVLAIDTGSNMSGLASGTTIAVPNDFEFKEDVAAELVTALAWLTATRGDRIALVAGDARSMETMPARSGLAHTQTLVHVATKSEPEGAPGDFNAVMRRVNAVRRNRALIVGITDIAQLDRVDPKYLKRLGMRHRLVFFVVEDFDPTILYGKVPGVTPTRSSNKNSELMDVFSGPLPEFATEDPAIAAQWHVAQNLRRTRVKQKLARFSMGMVEVGSPDDVPSALMKAFGGGSRASST